MTFALHTALAALHVTAISVGLGSALVADWIVASRFLFGTVQPGPARQVVELAKAVTIGLCVVWATGAILVSHNLIQSPASVLENRKFFAKLVVVVVLTLNAGLLHLLVLKRVSSRIGQPLFDDGLRWDSLLSTFGGAVSIVSWLTAAYLGVAREWNRGVGVMDILSLYAPAVLIVWGAGLCLVGVSSVMRPSVPDRQGADHGFEPAPDPVAT